MPKSENANDTLLAKAEGKTRRELDAYLATLAPKEEFLPSLRKQARRDGKQNAEAAPSERATSEEEPAPPSGGQRMRDRIEPATTERYNFRFGAGKAFTEKFRRLAEVLGIESPHRHLEEVFDVALESALEKRDPQRKLERRRKREAKKQPSSPGEKGNERSRVRKEGKAQGSMSGNTPGNAVVSRQVPSEVRERVLDRAGHRCEYRGPDGLRCSSRTGLHMEHTRPFAVCRTHDERYLRAFCPAHNLRAAETYYGSAFIRRKITAARNAKTVAASVGQSVRATSDEDLSSSSHRRFTGIKQPSETPIH